MYDCKDLTSFENGELVVLETAEPVFDLKDHIIDLVNEEWGQQMLRKNSAGCVVAVETDIPDAFRAAVVIAAQEYYTLINLTPDELLVMYVREKQAYDTYPQQALEERQEKTRQILDVAVDVRHWAPEGEAGQFLRQKIARKMAKELFDAEQETLAAENAEPFPMIDAWFHEKLAAVKEIWDEANADLKEAQEAFAERRAMIDAIIADLPE